MRAGLLTAALVCLVSLAGCSGEAPPAAPQDPEDGRRSVGGGVGGVNGTDPPHDKVVFFEDAILIPGQGSQGFDTVVPAGVTIVDFDIETPTLGAFTDLRVELEGCGVYSNAGANGGNVGMEGRICQRATSGPARLTVTNTGFIEGQITLVGQIPKAPSNSTTNSTSAFR